MRFPILQHGFDSRLAHFGTATCSFDVFVQKHLWQQPAIPKQNDEFYGCEGSRKTVTLTSSAGEDVLFYNLMLPAHLRLFLAPFAPLASKRASN